MTTASRLEAMTDRAAFELLATGVLRKASPDYAAIIHTGVNAAGETIADPLDGIGLVPNSDPPHYVLVHHTTTDRRSLRQKWLTGGDGDLPKALEKIRSIRRQQSNARFTVVLCTNQRPDSELVVDVTNAAHADQATADVWEQSRISGFLDNNPDGQWLRKVYLGIEAERLSEDLLAELCRKSVTAYRSELVVPERLSLIRREIADAIEGANSLAGVRLCLAVGSPGFGKSVACLQALESKNGTGGLGIWLPQDYVEEPCTIESALDARLRALHPLLEPNSGRVALELAAKQGGLLVVVDDVNRSRDVSRALRRLVGAATPLANGAETNAQPDASATNAQPSETVLVAPLWPEHLQDLPSGTERKAWIRIVSIGEMDEDECCRILRATSADLSDEEVRELAMRLGRDPFLVGLFASMADGESDLPALFKLAEDTVGEFVGRQLAAVSNANNFHLLASELGDALNSLARKMLLHRELRPSWDQVRVWFGSNSSDLEALRAIVSEASLCRLGSGERLVFRHDRLQERFLEQAADGLMRLENPPDDVILDPYFAAIVGRALCRPGHARMWLERFRREAPLVLFESIRHFGEPSEPHHGGILAQAREWAEKESSNAPPSVLDGVSWTLQETDSSYIEPILQAMPSNPVTSLAALRNGMIPRGLQYLRWHVSLGFEPGFNDILRDRVVRHAKHRHAPSIRRALEEASASTPASWDEAAAILAMVGHMGLSGMDETIASTWV